MKKVGSHFPNLTQTLLLKAALCEEDNSYDYFQKWLETTNLNNLDPTSNTFLSDFMDTLDIGSHRMLPLVIDNLGEESHPYFAALSGIRKSYWVRNKQIEHKAYQIQEALMKVGIPSMKIKGLDYATRYYSRTALRPMADGDILVPFKYLHRVMELIDEGYFGNKLNTLDLKLKKITHAAHLLFDGNIEIDLHWNVFAEYYTALDASDFIWNDAKATDSQGITNYVMSDTHALFLSIIRGRNFDYVPPFRWVADAYKIIKKGNIDWRVLIDLIQLSPYKPFLKNSIHYLNETFDNLIPMDFTTKVSLIPSNKLEEANYRYTRQNIKDQNLFQRIWFGIPYRLKHYQLFLKKSDRGLLHSLFHWSYHRLIAKLF